MKKMTILAVALLLTFSAFAKEKEAKKTPCKNIEEACKSAGYTKGGHKKDSKGLFEDCMKPIAAGQTVAGVTVSAEDVTACKEKAEKRKAKREEVKHEATDKRLEGHGN
jgi:hypothetical protein